MRNITKLLKRQVASEKSSALEGQRKYTFAVALPTTKKEAKEMIEELFRVKVERVNILRVKGKSAVVARFRRRTKKPDWKKAIVTLKEGEKLKALEGKKK